MAFSNFRSSSNAGGAGGLITQGADLEVIQTEGLGFLTVAGDAKVQLTPQWDPPPAPTASLLSIAPKKGLVAAAGPDGVYIATTESVRKAFEAPKSTSSEARPFQPQAKLALPIRISQLYFTADEQYLILSAESGGGLAVYEVEALNKGSSQATFELPTIKETLRQLVPNPMPELSGFCAVVTNNGNLLMANLQERKIGATLLNQVTCAAWSTKGKQLVAGRGDGTIHQITPDGTEKGVIPKPPSLGDYHVSSVTWLENHVFLAVHTPTNGRDSSVYHIITRQQQPGASAPLPSFTFQKLTDPVEPYVNDKVPHHTILRLQKFPPNLDELLVVASTAIESIGLVTKSKTPLASDKPADSITNVFTTTELADDSKRAQLPMGEDMSDTYPVGVTLDLSSKDEVYKPIPTDEIEESPGPLPGLWVLSNLGVLCVWWVVYNESIRTGTTYPGLAAVAEPAGAQAPAQNAFGTPVAAKTTAFGAASTSTPTAFGGASTSTPAAFGTPAAAKPGPFGAPTDKPNPFATSSTGSSAFGATATAQPAFGGTSALGAKVNPWATPAKPSAPAFGTSTFGSSTPAPAATQPRFGDPTFGLANTAPAPAFGQSAALGQKTNIWAKPASTATPAFGQSGFATAGAAATPGNKVFGSASTSTAPATGGFSAFANKPTGFGAIASTNSPNIFSQPSGGAAPSSKEISMDNDTAFSKPQSGSIFGAGSGAGSTLGTSPFVLGSTFKPDPKTANDNEDVKPGGGSSFFGGRSGVDNLLNPSGGGGDKATTPTVEKPKSIFESTTPATTPAPNRFSLTKTSGSNVFGSQPMPPPADFANPFAPKPKAPGAPDTESEASSEEFSEGSEGSESPRVREINDEEEFHDEAEIKDEEDSEEDKENLANIPEAPLPPNTTSSRTPSGKSVEDAPLPPDFLSVKSAKPSSPEPKTEDAPLPPDFLKTTKTPEKIPEAAPLPPDSLPAKSETESKETEPQSPEEAPLPPDFFPPKQSTMSLTALPEVPETTEEDDLEEGEVSEEDGEEAEEEEGDEDEHEGTEVGTEGSGVDVAKDLSPDVTLDNTFDLGGHTPGFTPQGSFTGMIGSTFSSFSQVEPQRQLFGEIRQNAPALAPFRPAAALSPRSPSPVRRGAVPSHLSRPEQSRSVSTPVMASQILGKQQGKVSFQNAAKTSFMVDANVEEQRRAQAKREEEEAQKLRDPMDEGIRQTLQAEIKPTLELDAFMAADSELPSVETRQKEPTGVQCETLWRDLNRMIDLVGLNSHSLQAFIQGHTTLFKEGGRTKEDLENHEDWVLVEAEDLGELVEGDLTRELEESRVKDIDQTHEAIRAMTRELTKLRAKQEDMHKIISSYVDPDQVAITKSLPLSAEQVTQRNEIRRVYASVIKLLSEAEESLTMLRAKIASIGGPSRKTGAPTVDAVIRTINKLTTMAEKRSGDVDVLEAQMRKMRLGTPGASTPRPGSREGSPFVAGTPSKTPLRKSVFMSPSPFRDSFSSSVGARGTPPRKKMSMYTEEERKTVLSKQAKRKGKLGMLRSALERAGPQVSTLEDE